MKKNIDIKNIDCVELKKEIMHERLKLKTLDASCAALSLAKIKKNKKLLAYYFFMINCNSNVI